MRRPPLWLLTLALGALAGSVLTVWATDRTVEEVATPTPTTAPAERTTTSSPTTTIRRSTTTTELEVGRRRNPLPLGDQAVRQDTDGSPLWAIQVLSFTPDATEMVMAENPSQDRPRAGHQYAMVRVLATYEGEVEPARLGESVVFEAVDDGNVTYDLDDECLIYPNELDQFNDVYVGGSIEGNLCWEVSTATVDSLLLAIKTGRFSNVPPYFMALNP